MMNRVAQSFVSFLQGCQHLMTFYVYIHTSLPMTHRAAKLSSPFFQGVMVTHTLQAMSEYERKHWVEAMGGTWPSISTLQRIRYRSRGQSF
jgi:hypothetical protein